MIPVGIAALVAVLVIGAVILRPDGGGNLADTPESPSSSTPAASESPYVTPIQKSTEDADGATAIPAVPDSIPTRLTIGDLIEAGFGEAAVPEAPLEAPSQTLLTRFENRGLPGSPGSDTVVILGSATGSLAGLDEIPPGTDILLTTEAGTLTYEAEEIESKPKNETLGSRWLYNEVPGRLVLIAAGSNGADDTLLLATLLNANR